ncbi:werner syndrome-like exonuclease [Plakobranchus ocellatus]|uniref:3'-5' exonuclease n=1 Tax=Plakobranchus ocellatus TaxID=259542 RepID=A0AAV3ZVR9_9GAST|nr:werner syndrome-like exonuclease [Plakobranchus ocellatus]
MAEDPHTKRKKRPLPQWMIALNDKQRGHKSTTCTDSDNSDISSSASIQNRQVSAADIISESMPLLKFEGSITYSYNPSDCACICLDILSRLDKDVPTVIGFDMEWPVTFNSATSMNSSKTAVIQMCLSEKECFLFHVSCMPSLPKPLQSLILNRGVILVGVNIEADLWKLERDFDIRVKPAIDGGTVVDLGKLANSKLKSSERWSLDGLCRNVLGKRLDKDRDLRCGNWTEYPLSKEQQIYACLDAFAGLELYNCLQLK